MSIEFHCGACGKSLKTTDDKAGRKARCPECGEMLVVPSSDPPAEEFNFNFEEAPVPGGTFNVGPAQGEELPPGERSRRRSEPKEPCPMCGELVGRSKVKCPYCGESLRQEARRRSGTGPNRITVDEVFGQAWDAFSNRGGLAIGATVLYILMNLVVYFVVVFIVTMVVGVGIFAAFGRRGINPITALGPAAVALIVGLVVFMVFSTWLTLGISRLFVRITRNDDRAELADLFAGGPQLGRAFGILMLYILLSIVLSFVLLFLATATRNLLVVQLIQLGISLFVILKFWGVNYVLVDQDPPGLRALSVCWEMMTGNHLTMFLTFLMLLMIHFIALLLPIFGGGGGGVLWLISLIFTVPFTFLIFASAYDLITSDDYEAEYE